MKVSVRLLICSLALLDSTSSFGDSGLTSVSFIFPATEASGADEGDVAHYGALIPSGGTWSQPTAETYAEGPTLMVLEVAPGRYRPVCGTERDGLAFPMELEVELGAEMHEVRCSFTPHGAVSGELVDFLGEPIADAVLMPLMISEGVATARLSKLGRRIARAAYASNTASDGSFVVVGPTGMSGEFVVSADRYAHRLLGPLTFPLGELKLGVLSMEQGATLQLELEDVAPGERYWVGIQARSDREMTVSPRTPPMSWWTREVEGERVVTFEGLLPNAYDVWVRRLEPGADRASTPEVVATSVLLAAGTRTETVSLELDPQTVSETRPLVLSVPGEELTDPRILRWTARGATDWPLVPKESPDGTIAWAISAENDDALVQILGRGTISPAVAPPSSGAERPLLLTVGRLALLGGSIEVPPKFEYPEVGYIEAEDCQSAQADYRPLSGIFPFEVEENGQFMAAIPAACTTAFLSVRGFVSHMVEALPSAEGSLSEIGPIRLIPAARLLARVLTSTGRPAPDVQVDLIPSERQHEFIAATVNGTYERGLARALTDSHGWVSWDDLPAGRFLLRATPERGIPTFSDAFELRSGDETVLEAVDLPEASALSVEIVLGDYPLNLTGELEVVVAGGSSCGWQSQALLQRTVQPGDFLQFAALHPGDWSVSLAIASEDGNSTVLREAAIHLRPGTSEQVRFTADAGVFALRLSRGAEPVVGDVLVLHPEANRLLGRGRSDDEGHLRIALGETGRFDVEIYRSNGRRTLFEEISFEDPLEPIELELPDGEISGQIVDAIGRPIEGARVQAQRERGIWKVPDKTLSTSESDGSFILEDLNPGKWNLRATAGDSSSAIRSLEVDDSGTSAFIRLSLERGVVVEGVVSRWGHPAGGVTGRAWCLWTPVESPCGGTFRTAEDGEFRLPLGPVPPDAKLNLILTAPEGTWTALLVPAISEKLHLEFPALNAHVLIESSTLSAHQLQRLLLVNDSGGMLPVGAAVNRNSTGWGLTLAAGRWQIVEVEMESSPFGKGSLGPLPGIPLASFTAAPASSVRVPLPPR